MVVQASFQKHGCAGLFLVAKVGAGCYNKRSVIMITVHIMEEKRHGIILGAEETEGNLRWTQNLYKVSGLTGM